MSRKIGSVLLICTMVLSITLFAPLAVGKTLWRVTGDPIDDPKPNVCLTGDPIDDPKPNVCLTGDPIDNPKPNLLV